MSSSNWYIEIGKKEPNSADFDYKHTSQCRALHPGADQQCSTGQPLIPDLHCTGRDFTAHFTTKLLGRNSVFKYMVIAVTCSKKLQILLHQKLEGNN